MKDLETKLAEAEAGKGELSLTKALNAHLADIAKEIPQLGAAVNAFPKELDFLRDIPVIDIAATGVAAELQARDDINKGWSPDHARAADYGAAGIYRPGRRWRIGCGLRSHRGTDGWGCAYWWGSGGRCW